MTSRRDLLRAASGVVAAGVVGGALLDATHGTASATSHEATTMPYQTGSEFYVSIEGTKQGRFVGDNTRERRSDWITGLGFYHRVSSPRDATTGLATGKRQHQPIVITKLRGAASPQLIQALVTNEILKSVIIEFVRTTGDGVEETHYRITLTNATIADIEQYTNFNAAGHREAHYPLELEDISFTYQTITVESLWGKTTATDQWSK